MATQSPRVNRRIRIPQVRVINDDGEQLGVITLAEALAEAAKAGM
ncbi:MAG: translation initiation factor IF-3, partial [Candidatus Zixiibacteriota bacterium]